MNATVVIATMARQELLRECLKRLSGCKVIVVDSSPKPARLPKKISENVSYVHAPGLNASAARNHGTKKSKSEYIVFLDDDTFVGPGWAPALERAMRDGEDAVVGLSKGKYSYFLPSKRHHVSSQLKVMNATNGNNWAVKKSLFNALGGFNEELGPGSAYKSAEDTELMFRVLGVTRVLVEPAMAAEHMQKGGPHLYESYALGFGRALRLHLLEPPALALLIGYFAKNLFLLRLSRLKGFLKGFLL